MGTAAISSKIDRRHPLLSQEYAVYTPPMDEMIATIGDWIDHHESGGYIYGPSRFGKSRCVKWYLRAELKQRFSHSVPLVVWSRPYGQRTEGEFWNALLGASGFRTGPSTQKPKQKMVARQLFKDQLITCARRARGKYVVLMIDEAQDMTLAEWLWLMGLQNELDYIGFRFSVFSIGSHQMQYQPNYLERTGNAHIVARFFVRDARFHGICNAAELKYVFNGYDEDSEWPAGSGTSFLKYFAPEAFEKKLRLANHADHIWNVFLSLIPEMAKDKAQGIKPEIPMKQVALLAENILSQLADGQDWDDLLDSKYLSDLMHQNRFPAHMLLVYSNE